MLDVSHPTDHDGDGEAGPRETSRYRVPAAARTLALIELLAETRVAHGVSEIARQLAIPKSSCFGLLTTLEAAGYVRRNEQEEWSGTLRVYHVGLAAARNVDLLVVAQPIVDELCNSTGLTAHLGVFDGRSVSYALKAERAEGMVKFDTYPGKAASLHLTAIGRAIATVLPDRDLQGLLHTYEFAGGYNPRIRDRAGFLAELEMIRHQGYAFEDEEEALGVSCVAAPLLTTNAATAAAAAAIGITALSPQVREASIETISQRVMAAATSLSVLLGDRGRVN